MAGDYLHWQFQFTRKNTDFQIAAADTATVTALTARSANHQIYVQRIVFSCTTSAAQNLTFQDSASTPVPIAKSVTSPAIGTQVWDFGPVGTPLTTGKNLSCVLSAAGLAGRVHIEAYERLVGPVAAASTN